MPPSYSRKLLVILIFGVLPVVAIYLLANRLIDFRESQRKEALKEAVSNKLVAVAQKTSPEGFYFQLFDGLQKRLHSVLLINDLNKTRDLLKSAASNYQCEFLTYLFDENGEVIQVPDLPLPNRFIISKVWDILAETRNYTPGEDERKQSKRLQLLLGAETNAGRLKNMEGRLISLKKRKTDGFFYWKRFSAASRAGVVFLAMPCEKTSSILLKHLAVADRNGFQIAWWNHESVRPLFTHVDESHAMLVRNNLEQQNQFSETTSYRFWRILKTESGVLIGSLPSIDNQLQNVRGMLNLCFVSLMMLFMILLLSPGFNLQTTDIRIGSKLSAIVLVAVAVPVSALILTGVLAISDHEKVLLSRIEKEQKQRLSAIEDEFVSEEISFSRYCKHLRQQLLNKFELSAFNQDLKEMISRRQAVRIELRGLDGDLLSLFNSGGYFEGLEKTNDGFSRYLIKQHLGKRLHDENVTLKRAPDSVFNDIYSSSDFGFAQISAAPDKVHAFRFGQNELFWYWTYVNVPGHKVAIVSIFQAVDLARENFLHRMLKVSLAGSEKLGAYDSNRQVWLKGGLANTSAARDLIRAALVTGKPESRILTLPEGRFVAMAYPGALLAPFSLLSLVSDEPVTSRLWRLSLALTSGIVLIMFVAFSIAQLLARTFMQPIGELDRGMRQIQAREADAKVLIDSGDEFGILGEAFNQMIDDLNEMQLAKVVQESLFPQAKPQIPGFDTAIFNLTATDLGGDYCDVLKVAGNKWLLLIGDVSGHGTPAALAMAMVKAAIFKACRDGLQFSQLPESLSTMLLNTLSRKKMMTMLFVLLDSADSSMQLINAGHNWPLILHQDGKVEELSLQGLPLGVRASKRLRETVTRQLEPGETLFCYTDALVECQSPEGQVFGHPRLYSELQLCQGMSAQQTIDQITSGWFRFLAGGVREDDLTLMVIKKCLPEVCR